MGRRIENAPKELAARLAENPAERLAEMLWWADVVEVSRQRPKKLTHQAFRILRKRKAGASQ
jgi:hypothetical protein